MTKTQPNPGHGYIVRERLGRGRWKEVYRAVVRGEWHDRALARFIEQPDAIELFDEIKLLFQLTSALKNVARLYPPFKGDDGDVYIPEELLYRPIETLAPLKMVDQFFRIAHDLCSGLASLHQLDRVHRDLKLDNCGIDHFGVAKIFDLGSVTSEGGRVKGTTLSRAPELFRPDARCTKQSDVWAMGAVLYALRTGGDYPFVTRDEAKSRPLDGEAREKFDKMVLERAHDPKAESVLRLRISEEFPNGSGQLLSRMLDFDPASRPPASECAEEWLKLLRPWISATAPATVEQVDAKTVISEDIVAYLTAVLRGTAEMSSLQWERVLSAIEKLERSGQLEEAKMSRLQELRRSVGERRQSVVA